MENEKEWVTKCGKAERGKSYTVGQNMAKKHMKEQGEGNKLQSGEVTKWSIER